MKTPKKNICRVTFINMFCYNFIMFIKRLGLKNFRNYSDTDISFSKNKILFVGKNAQGKTNLLEAVFYLSSLDSLRAKSDSELIKWNSDICNIQADIEKFGIDVSLEINLPAQGRKKLKVNGLTKNKFSEFISNISTVCFTTSDLLLLRGTPEDRRKWLDLAISQIYPAFIERLTKYNKIKTQKNNYLKTLKGNLNADTSLLDIWNEQLAITGSNITFIRINFLHELQKAAKEKHKEISAEETLTLKYNSTILGDINLETRYANTTEYIAKLFKEKLDEKKQEEIIRAQSVVGPHRDDITYFINNIEAKKFASQGQQRTIVLALKLAELNLIKEKIQTNAILLLDDVLAELDDLRQNFLLNAIGEETQTIITSVDTLHFKEEYLKDVEIFEIKDNQIIKK